jgi:hypothetical protein
VTQAFRHQGDGTGAFSRARCRGTKRREEWARRRSPCKAQRIANEFSPESFIRPSPIKRKFDGGEAMKDTWATEKRSRRTGVAMKVDAQGHKHSRICSVTKDWGRRFQTKVAGARFRGDVPGQGY